MFATARIVRDFQRIFAAPRAEPRPIAKHQSLRQPGCGQASFRWRKDVQSDTAEGHPAGEFLLLDDLRQPDALDARHAKRYPRAGSQSYPSPAAQANADGSTTVFFSPTQPDGVARGNWIQTVPGKGWFLILRLYSPLEPFFTKQWRVSEVELVH